MLLMKRAPLSSQGFIFQFCLKQHKNVISPISYKAISEKSEAVNIHKNKKIVQLQRSLHVTGVNRDLEGGLKALGAGIAATGVIGSGIGLGIIFGNLLSAMARNPSVGKQIMTQAIMGAAFCESLGLFAVTIAFVVMT